VESSLTKAKLKPFVFHHLPRLDSDDGLSAARELVGGETEWFYLPTVQSLIEVLQKQPVVIELNWYEDFNHPVKHPFLKAQRRFFFIGENISLGKLLGSHALVACGYHKARTGAVLDSSPELLGTRLSVGLDAHWHSEGTIRYWRDGRKHTGLSGH
jgi:hypothetical protein